MKKISVMLVCGGGASSGFLAQNMRRYAESKQLVIDVFARSESEIVNYKQDIDVLFIGPHLKYLLEDAKKRLVDTNVKVEVIDDMVYATLDGEKAVNRVLALMEEV